MSGVQVVSIKGGQITGLKLIFEGVPVISDIVLRYREVEILNTTEKIIESKMVSNMGKEKIPVKVAFEKNYSFASSWTTPLGYFGGYKLNDKISVEVPYLSLKKS